MIFRRRPLPDLSLFTVFDLSLFTVIPLFTSLFTAIYR